MEGGGGGGEIRTSVTGSVSSYLRSASLFMYTLIIAGSIMYDNQYIIHQVQLGIHKPMREGNLRKCNILVDINILP